MSYYYPNNLYPAPNTAMNNANALCANIATYQNSTQPVYTPINYSYLYNNNSLLQNQNPSLNFGEIAGLLATTIGGVAIANTQSDTLKQGQMFQAMAYNDSSGRIAQQNEWQMGQQATQNAFNMMAMMKIMDYMDKA